MISQYNSALVVMRRDGRVATLSSDGNGNFAVSSFSQFAIEANAQVFEGLATDGQSFYGCIQRNVPRFGATFERFDSIGPSTSGVSLAEFVEYHCPVAARDGLAIAAYDDHGDGRIIVTRQDAVRWSRTLPAGVPFATAAQGCGLAYIASADGHDGTTPAVVTWLAFDGPERSIQFDFEWIPFTYAWPYEPHSLAILTQPENTTEVSCPISLRVIDESTGTVTTQTFDHDCSFPIAAEGFVTASLIPASFGAVLHDGSGHFQLLDPSGVAMGATVSIPIASRADIALAAFEQFVVVLLAENGAVTQTVIACD